MPLRSFCPKASYTWIPKTPHTKMSCLKRNPSTLRHLNAHFEKDSQRFLMLYETQHPRVRGYMVFTVKGIGVQRILHPKGVLLPQVFLHTKSWPSKGLQAKKETLTCEKGFYAQSSHPTKGVLLVQGFLTPRVVDALGFGPPRFYYPKV